MNIIIETYKGKIVTRPDTSWKSRDESFYAPEFVKRLSISPIMFLKICRAGKCIASKFAGRYYDTTGYGFLLYAENLIDGSEEGFSCASCLDHTSFFPDLSLDGNMAAAPSCNFEIRNGDRSIVSAKGISAVEAGGLIERASSRCLLRNADIVAVELAERRMIEPQKTDIETFLEGKAYQRIKIIF